MALLLGMVWVTVDILVFDWNVWLVTTGVSLLVIGANFLLWDVLLAPKFEYGVWIQTPGSFSSAERLVLLHGLCWFVWTVETAKISPNMTSRQGVSWPGAKLDPSRPWCATLTFMLLYGRTNYWIFAKVQSNLGISPNQNQVYSFGWIVLNNATRRICIFLISNSHVRSDRLSSTQIGVLMKLCIFLKRVSFCIFVRKRCPFAFHPLKMKGRGLGDQIIKVGCAVC
jgi:hypothetical protein